MRLLILYSISMGYLFISGEEFSKRWIALLSHFEFQPNKKFPLFGHVVDRIACDLFNF